MGKQKTKDWVQKNVSLERKVADKIKEGAKFEEMNETEFIEFLVSNWDSGINPENKFNELIIKRKVVVADLAELDLKIQKINSQITLFREWRKEKESDKETGIKFLEKLILERDFVKVEEAAKIWQRKTGVASIDLIMEAKENIEKSGV